MRSGLSAACPSPQHFELVHLAVEMYPSHVPLGGNPSEAAGTVTDTDDAGGEADRGNGDVIDRDAAVLVNRNPALAMIVAEDYRAHLNGPTL